MQLSLVTSELTYMVNNLTTFKLMEYQTAAESLQSRDDITTTRTIVATNDAFT